MRTREQHVNPEDSFKKRKELIKKLHPGMMLKYGHSVLLYSHTNNPFFPRYIYGENPKTHEIITIRLTDEDLHLFSLENEKASVPGPKVVTETKDRPSSSPIKHWSLEDYMNASNSAYLAFGQKSSKGGMSSQLILRAGSIKYCREVGYNDSRSEFLPGEQDYEEARHSLHVFYQTKNFSDLPSEVSTQALKEMLALQKIDDEKERQQTANRHPLFGLHEKA